MAGGAQHFEAKLRHSTVLTNPPATVQRHLRSRQQQLEDGVQDVQVGRWTFQLGFNDQRNAAECEQIFNRLRHIFHLQPVLHLERQHLPLGHPAKLRHL